MFRISFVNDKMIFATLSWEEKAAGFCCEVISEVSSDTTLMKFLVEWFRQLFPRKGLLKDFRCPF